RWRDGHHLVRPILHLGWGVLGRTGARGAPGPKVLGTVPVEARVALISDADAPDRQPPLYLWARGPKSGTKGGLRSFPLDRPGVDPQARVPTLARRPQILVQDSGADLQRQVSSAEESHPRALPEPYVNVSAHTAPIISRLTVTPPVPSGQTAQA